MSSDLLSEREVRQKFWDLARKQYPDVGEPGTVWVLTEVLGYNWDMVCSISVDGISRKGYRMKLPDSTVVFRSWSTEEKRKLKEFWWLLGY